MKVIDKEDEIITETHDENDLISITIFYKADGKIEKLNNSGAKQVPYFEDFIEDMIV